MHGKPNSYSQRVGKQGNYSTTIGHSRFLRPCGYNYTRARLKPTRSERARERERGGNLEAFGGKLIKALYIFNINILISTLRLSKISI